MIGVKLKANKEMSLSGNIESFDKVDTVYIPVTDSKIMVKENQKVTLGEQIAVKDDIPIFSSVSGKVIGIIKMYSSNNQKIDCIQIKNDFKDQIKEEYDNENFGRFSKETFIENIKNAGILGLGGAGFPAYLKYQPNKKITTLIINAVECEPYITADQMNVTVNITQILKTLQAIIRIFEIDTCYIGVKKKNYKLREIFITATSKMPNIKVIDVPNLYPMGWEKSLVRYIKHIDYNNIPLEKGIVVSNVSTIYAIYEALRFQKPFYEHVVTFSGQGVKEPKNLLVRNGTRVGDILEKLKINGDDVDFYLIAGGPMMGSAVESDDLVIDSTLNSVLLLPIKDNKETTCLRCGKCVDNCPVKICPILVKESLKDKNALKRLHPERCIECGICSFICPAKINLREYVKKAKEKCREAQK